MSLSSIRKFMIDWQSIGSLKGFPLCYSLAFCFPIPLWLKLFISYPWHRTMCNVVWGFFFPQIYGFCCLIPRAFINIVHRCKTYFIPPCLLEKFVEHPRFFGQFKCLQPNRKKNRAKNYNTDECFKLIALHHKHETDSVFFTSIATNFRSVLLSVNH